jgi:hypothetical protein
MAFDLASRARVLAKATVVGIEASRYIHEERLAPSLYDNSRTSLANVDKVAPKLPLEIGLRPICIFSLAFAMRQYIAAPLSYMSSANGVPRLSG